MNCFYFFKCTINSLIWSFLSYRIRRHTDRNPEGATHSFRPTRCKLKMILLQEGPKCYKSLSQLKTLTLLLSSSSCQLISGLHAFSDTMLHIFSRRTCFSNAFGCEQTLEFWNFHKWWTIGAWLKHFVYWFQKKTSRMIFLEKLKTYLKNNNRLGKVCNSNR